MTLDSRRGATLSEILISLMVMSIGVVSLATLFPISVLRSIQATQLTNSTIHRLNAEELISVFPRLVHDPDFDGNIAEHEIQNTVGGLDNPENSVDGVNEGRFIVDPLGAASPALAGVNGVFGNNNGAAPTNPIRRYAGGIINVWGTKPTYQLGDMVVPATSPVAGLTQPFVYQATSVASPYTPGGMQPTWPTTIGATVTDGNITWTCLRFLDSRAGETSYLADSWQQQAKGNVLTTTFDTTTTPPQMQITAPAGVDLATSYQALNPSGAVPPAVVRVVVYSVNGNQSATRLLSPASINTAASTITWTESSATPLPNAFYIDTDGDGVLDTLSFSRFRLETYDPRYSWLLTVRKTPDSTNPGHGPANVDVVIFHKRSYSPASEQVFAVKSWIGYLCILDLTSAPPGTKPFLKKGGYLFDVQHAHWYRITNLKYETTVSPQITLDRQVIAPVDSNGNQVPPSRVMAAPGIVDVYPIGSVSYDSSNAP